MKRLKTRLVLLVVCCLVGSAAWAQNVIYVNAIAAGASNGSSWADAFKDLQDAINLANPGDEIWVAAGTYRPRRDINGVFSPTSRLNTFYFNKDVAVYGGFQGTETALIQRVCNPASPTILSGDLGTLGDATDNTLHVCYSDFLTTAFLMECVTIEQGHGIMGATYADGAGWYNNGGGGTSRPTFRNCIFRNNLGARGGAFHNNGTNGGEASPEFINCEFRDNTAQTGAAIYNDGQSGVASPSATNCAFIRNTAGSGGAIYNNGILGNADGLFTDCSFANNSAKIGGAVYLMADNGTSRGAFDRCTFTNNVANDNGGAVGATAVQGDAKTTFTRCTFELNRASRLGGAVWNFGASPWFVDCGFLRNNSSDNGGAMYNDGSNGMIGNPRVTSCEFKENTAVNNGGAMYNLATLGDASPFVLLSKFIANSASAGGAIYNNGGGNATAGQIQATYYNCLFSRNSCVGRGAVAYNIADGGSCTPAFASCSFAGNTAGVGSLFYLNQLNGGTCNVRTYNMASHGHGGTVAALVGGATVQAFGGMYEAGLSAACSGPCYVGGNPMFTNPAADDLTLQAGSPAINVGLNAWSLPQFPVDLAGNARIQGTIVDLGAYETATPPPPPPCPRVIYVNKIAPGLNNGKNWNDAYRDLQSALAEARINPCTDTILIAKGTYKPTSGPGVNRNANFELVNDIEIYGGFPDFGNPWFPDRDLVQYETILSGDIGMVGNPNDNSFIVVSGKGTANGGPATFTLNAGTILHGVSITDGVVGLRLFADSNTNCKLRVDSCDFYNGRTAILTDVANAVNAAAINVTMSPEFRNCRVFNNLPGFGSAVKIQQYVIGSITNPYFYKCEFFNNLSTQMAGAVLAGGQVSPKFENCIFRYNTSTGNGFNQGGGAVYLETGGFPPSPAIVNQSSFINCSFHHNTAPKGGAIFTFALSNNVGTTSKIEPKFLNCTFGDNSAAKGSTLYSKCEGARTDIDIKNSITWGNGNATSGAVVYLEAFAAQQNRLTFTNSLIESPTCGTAARLFAFTPGVSTIVCGAGNIFNLNPQFQNAAAWDYRLSPGSPGINAGNNAFVSTSEDISGNDRIHAASGGIVDMGCYENYPGAVLRSATGVSPISTSAVAGDMPDKADQPSSNGASLDEDNAVVIYPNPATDVLHLDYTAGSFGEGEIIDQMGRVVARIAVDATTVDVSSLADGIYLLRLFSGDHVVIRRFVKE